MPLSWPSPLQALLPNTAADLLRKQQGKFARQWIAENNSGRRKYSKLLKADLSHSIEKVGAQLRARMPWLEGNKA